MHLLLLHGLAGAPEDWCATVSHLPGARALTPRLNYLSMCTGGLPVMAKALLHSLPPWFEPHRAVIAGNSLGAALALLAGAPFARIVLVAPHMRIIHGRLDRGMQTVRRELARIFHAPDRLHALQVREYERLWRRASATRQGLSKLRQLKRRVQSFDLDEHLSQNAQKVLLVSGRDDALTPLPLLRSLHWKHPGMELRVLESCGHAVPLERPKALAQLIFHSWQDQEKNFCPEAKKHLPSPDKTSRRLSSEHVAGKNGLTAIPAEHKVLLSWGG